MTAARQTSVTTGGGARSERGSITTFVVLMVVPVLMMAALAFDGGVILAERRAALDAAQNAALAGSQAIATNSVRQGEVALDPGAAAVAAGDHLAAIGRTGTIEVGPPGAPTVVTVTVRQQVELRLLSVIGIEAKTVSATASSRITRGVEAADT